MARPTKPSRPLILITPSTQAQGAEFEDRSISLSLRYTDAVMQAGGMPWILPPTADPELVRDAIGRSDGVLLSGGDDISPAVHRPDAPEAVQRLSGTPDIPRDVFELLVLQQLFSQPRPLLAVCRGHQLINVALGGTLYLDLATERPSDVPHNACDRKDEGVHPVALDPRSILGKDQSPPLPAGQQHASSGHRPTRARTSPRRGCPGWARRGHRACRGGRGIPAVVCFRPVPPRATGGEAPRAASTAEGIRRSLHRQKVGPS